MEYEPPQIRMGVKHPLQHSGYLRHAGVEGKVVRDDLARQHVLDRAEAAFAPRDVELAAVGRPLLVRLEQAVFLYGTPKEVILKV